MPVTGIQSILCGDYANFEPLFINNCPVVVDGVDFIDHFRKMDISHYIFGGEYLSMAVEWNEILRGWKKCEIDAIFLFSAGTEKKGKQILYEFESLKRNLTGLSHLNERHLTPLIPKIKPILSQQCLIDLLDFNEIEHLNSPFCQFRSCAALSNRMQCPLLGTSDEYLLLSYALPNMVQTGFTYLPLFLMDRNPARLPKILTSTTNNNKSNGPSQPKEAISGHQFHPELSSLTNYAPFYRPLAFLLLGTDSMPRIKLPNFLHGRIHGQKDGDYKTRRWQIVCDWLRQFKPPSAEPLRQICNSYSPEEREKLTAALMQSLATYLPSPFISQRLTLSLIKAPLQVDHHVKPNLSCSTSVDKKISIVTTNKNGGIRDWPSEVCQLLNDPVNLSSHPSIKPPDFTNGWPPTLVHAFNASLLAPHILSALYSSSPGAILPCLIEKVSVESSIWLISLPLRAIHYSILKGLEKEMGKSTTIREKAVEFIRNGDQLISVQWPIYPYDIKMLQSRGTEELLSDWLGLALLDSRPQTSEQPLFSLIVSLAVWQMWQMEHTQECLPVTESPIVLSVILCAVANVVNFRTLDDKLTQFYLNVSSGMEAQLRGSGTNNNGFLHKNTVSALYRLDYVHALNGIQTVFSLLKSLVELLNTFTVAGQPRSKCMSFDPVWKVFPSGRLVHWLAACLANVEPNRRRHCAVRFWLPRLFRFEESQSAVGEIQRSIILFNTHLSTLIQLLNDKRKGETVDYSKLDVQLADLSSFRTDDVAIKTSQSKIINTGSSLGVKVQNTPSPPVLPLMSNNTIRNPNEGANKSNPTTRNHSVSRAPNRDAGKLDHAMHLNRFISTDSIQPRQFKDPTTWNPRQFGRARQQDNTNYSDRLKTRLRSGNEPNQ